MAVLAGTCITIAATTKELQGYQRGPLRRASFLLASGVPSSPEYTIATVEARQIWHGCGCCVIETESAGAMALPDFLLASQLFSRRFSPCAAHSSLPVSPLPSPCWLPCLHAPIPSSRCSSCRSTSPNAAAVSPAASAWGRGPTPVA